MDTIVISVGMFIVFLMGVSIGINLNDAACMRKDAAQIKHTQNVANEPEDR